MSLYRRKDSPVWWVDISHGGKRIQRSSGTSDKAKAREYHDKLKSALWDQERLGVRPRYLWQDAVVRVARETAYRASRDTDRARFRWLDGYLRDVALADINRSVLERLIEAKSRERVEPATVNRVLQLV